MFPRKFCKAYAEVKSYVITLCDNTWTVGDTNIES